MSDTFVIDVPEPEGETCPKGCQLSYIGREGDRHSRTIGVEVQGVYDGVLYWMCAGCGCRWNRWEPGDRLFPIAEEYMRDPNGS